MKSHPRAPSEIEDTLALHLAAVYYPGLAQRLLEAFGSPSDVFRQSPIALGRAAPVPRAAIEKILAPSTRRLAAEEVLRAERRGTRLIVRGDPDYPASLLSLDGMPLVLYADGCPEALCPLRPSGSSAEPDCWADPEDRRRREREWEPPGETDDPDPDPDPNPDIDPNPNLHPGPGPDLVGHSPDGLVDGLVVGIVGTRRPTLYAARQARRFAVGLARRGFTVASGLAAGVDGEAHRGALEAGESTVAVLGSGLDRIYPPQHVGLARAILDSGRGAVITELPFGAAPLSQHFPPRNRIISGLCRAVLIVEAGERSGSLITARYALDQGKSVYVVPGRIAPETLGGLRLLEDGATPALAPGDVLPDVLPAGRAQDLEDIPRDGPPEGSREGPCGRARPLDGLLGEGLALLFREEDAWHADRIAERLGRPPAAVLAELGRLEIAGILERVPGGAYALREGGDA